MRFFSERNIINLRIALDSIAGNKTRAFLTALGIIFGVAAVIAMLAIGNGAKIEILEQIKLVGANNIVIKPILEQKDKSDQKEQKNSKEEVKKFSPGLTIADLEAIEKIIPEVVYLANNEDKAIAYHNLIAVIIEAIKEISVRLKKLEEKINI